MSTESFDPSSALDRLGRGCSADVRGYGVAHASGYSTFWSFPKPFFGVLASEGLITSDGPEGIDEKVKLLREHNFAWPCFAVVEGSRDWLLRYRRHMSEPDYVVYCGTEVDLDFLGVPILDRGWEVGGTQISMADVLREAP